MAGELAARLGNINRGLDLKAPFKAEQIMKIIIHIMLTISVVVATLFFYNFNDNVEIVNRPSEQQAASKNSETTGSDVVPALQFVTPHDNDFTSLSATPQTPEQLASSDPETIAHSKAIAFFNSPAFKSAETVNAAYLNYEGIVSRDALEMSFSNNDFNQLVNAIKNADKNSASFELEATLEQHLLRTLSSKVFDESYSCAGSVCALTFKAMQPEQNVESVKDFTTSYTFTNISQDDTGVYIYKAIFIQTTDPSNLQIQ